MYQVVKRDGRRVDFDLSSIASAIQKAFDATEMPYDKDIIRMLTGYCADWSLRQLIEGDLAVLPERFSALTSISPRLCVQIISTITR